MKRVVLLVLLGLLMTFGGQTSARAQEQFIGQLLLTANNFCSRGYLPADGRLLPVAQNSALFSLIGCTYGGDCRTTFALPDLRGRVAIGVGQGPGLPNTPQGQVQGAPNTTLTVAQLPAHRHSLLATSEAPSDPSPANARLATFNGQNVYATGAPANTPMQGNAIGNAGGSQPFSQYQPTLTLNYCIAIEGIFPSRN